jgi:hypothetical protein
MSAKRLPNVCSTSVQRLLNILNVPDVSTQCRSRSNLGFLSISLSLRKTNDTLSQSPPGSDLIRSIQCVMNLFID